jgi:hypothetical protein
VVRASSAVECVNSVLRTQQGRHRNLSPGMLDLELHNGKYPYQLFGTV